MCRRHEVGDEPTAGCRTGKRIRANAEPAAVVAAVVVFPEVLVRLQIQVGQHNGTAPRLRPTGATIATWVRSPNVTSESSSPGRDQRDPARARVSEATAGEPALVTSRVDLRNFGRCALGSDGCARSPDDLEVFLLGLQPDEVFRPRRVAVSRRAARLHASGDDRRENRPAEDLGTGLAVRDRARRHRDRCERASRRRRGASFRAWPSRPA